MKIFLDDVREAPRGWVRTKTPDETIILLNRGDVTEISLDHDLGDDVDGDGYDVLLWMENEMQVNGDFVMPGISLHTMNPVARERMEACIASMERWFADGCQG